MNYMMYMNYTFSSKNAESKVGYIITSLILLAFVFLSSCGGSGPEPVPEPTEQEKVTALLTANTWKPASGAGWVTIDGFDGAELFPNFTLTFTKTGYTTTGDTPVWPRSGTWHFLTGSTTVIIRDIDDLQVTINNVNDTSLKLTLVWAETTTVGGRQKSLAGTHVFNFTK
jgi:hypothetical protein